MNDSTLPSGAADDGRADHESPYPDNVPAAEDTLGRYPYTAANHIVVENPSPSDHLVPPGVGTADAAGPSAESEDVGTFGAASSFATPLPHAASGFGTFAPVAPATTVPAIPAERHSRGSVMYFVLGALFLACGIAATAIGTPVSGALLLASPVIVVLSIVVLFTMRR